MSVHANDPKLQPRTPRRRIVAPWVDLKDEPDTAAETISQALYGEAVHDRSQAGEWLQVTLQRDGYTGYLRESALMPLDHAATHRVDERATLLFRAPDIKSPGAVAIAYSSELVLTGETHQAFAATDTGHWVWGSHCMAVDAPRVRSPSEFALQNFTGVPYLWGGRTPAGLDCSALVQLSAFAAGHALPRDSGDQCAALTHVVNMRDRHRDDLIFWPGHVGILTDAEHVFHATAHTLNTMIETISDVVARAGEPSGVRRLPVHLQAIRS